MLPELPEEVPEPGLGHDGVGGEDLHAVEGSHGLRLGGKLPSDHTELLQSSLGLHFSSETTLLSFIFKHQSILLIICSITFSTK